MIDLSTDEGAELFRAESFARLAMVSLMKAIKASNEEKNIEKYQCLQHSICEATLQLDKFLCSEVGESNGSVH